MTCRLIYFAVTAGGVGRDEGWGREAWAKGQLGKEARRHPEEGGTVHGICVRLGVHLQSYNYLIPEPGKEHLSTPSGNMPWPTMVGICLASDKAPIQPCWENGVLPAPFSCTRHCSEDRGACWAGPLAPGQPVSLTSISPRLGVFIQTPRTSDENTFKMLSHIRGLWFYKAPWHTRLLQSLTPPSKWIKFSSLTIFSSDTTIALYLWALSASGVKGQHW